MRTSPPRAFIAPYLKSKTLRKTCIGAFFESASAFLRAVDAADAAKASGQEVPSGRGVRRATPIKRGSRCLRRWYRRG